MRLTLILFFLFHSVASSQNVRTFEMHFPKGSPELTASLKDSILDFLRGFDSHKIISLKIFGYCYEEKEMLFNFTLSERRARAVYDFIEDSRKVGNSVMSYKGYGKTMTKSGDAVEVIVTYREKARDPQPEVKKKRTSTINKDSLLAGKSIRLNLNFFPGESTLLPAAIPSLDELERFLKENPEIRIQIDGHVCCNNNMQLSVERAAEVYDQLVKRGVSSSRLVYKGFGNSRPLVIQEETNEDREKNRRVEIKLLR